jgi:sulfur-carrier protein
LGVKVKLFATLREGREKVVHIDSKDLLSVLDVINMLRIKGEEVSILLINGRDAKLEQLLSDGDVLSLFPPVGGG